jgi:PAS domain S-box-containing protein
MAITLRISLALVLLQCVLSYVVFDNFKGAIRGNVKKQQSALVDALAHQLDEQIEQHLRLVEGIAKELPPQALADPSAAARFLELHREAPSVFDHGLLLVSREGELLADYPGNSVPSPGVEPAFRQYLKQLASQRKPGVSLPYLAAGGEPFVIFAAPVVGEDGAVRALLGGAVTLRNGSFLGNVAQARIGSAGYLYLVSRDRTILVHPDRDRVMKGDLAPGVNRLLDRAIAGFNDSGETVDANGVEVVASFKGLQTAPWVLGGKFPVQEAYAPLRSAISKLLLALSFTMLGSCVALFAIVRRLKAEMAKRAEAEDQSTLLLASVGEGVVGVDAAGVIYFVNKTALDQLGYDSAGEVAGRNARELFHQSSADCRNCDRHSCRIFSSFADGSSNHAENETLWRRDGSSFSTDLSCRPVWNGTTLAGAVITFKDVTEQKKTRERLRVQGAALEAAAISILITDSCHRILWVNRGFTRQTGYTLEEALGQQPVSLLSGCDNEELFRELGETLARKEPWHGEVISRRKDGTLYHEEVTITPVLDEEGEVTHFIGIMQDVSERRSSEEALRDSNLALEEANGKLRLAIERANELAVKAERASAAKSEFLANMSHEIRTPMNAIIGVGHLLRQTRLTEKQKDFLKTLTVSADALLGIIDDILDISKIEAGRLEIEQVRFEPQQVLGKILSLIRPKAEEKGIRVTSDLDHSVPSWLMGDPLRLGQILNNLLGNALKFTSAGEIAVRVRVLRRVPEGVELEFSVRDTGIGIREQDLAGLFEPFTQIDGSITRNYGGTGLGLAICRKLSRLMGGEIWCQSTPGLGSTFFFTLPFAAAAGGGTETPPRKPQEPARFHAEKVLLVEDNVFNQQVAVALLENAGLRVTVAGNGIEALQLVGAEQFDVVLMDIQMPMMDGLATAREIRRRGQGGAGIPIVAVSANASDQDVRESFAAGMNGHITKPYTPEVLYGVISRWLDEKRASRNARLDVEKAVRQIGGDRKLYRDLLGRFVEEYGEKGKELRRDVTAGNLLRASHLAHAIKGVAGVLAAMTLQSAAQDLESALKQEKGDLEPLLSRFDEELAATLERVREELGLDQ